MYYYTVSLKKIVYLKLRVIGEIEPNKSGEESNISLSEGVSSEVAVCRQNAFNTIQCSKHFPHSHVIGSLGPGKTSTVHTIVDLPADVHGLILISEYTDVDYTMQYNYENRGIDLLL